MRFFSVILTAASLFAADTPAQIKGRQIVDQALAALGGPKFMAMLDRTETGRMYTFYREQLNGLAHARLYTLYTAPKQPGALGQRERQSIGKDKEDYAYLFMEEEGMQLTYRGARPFPAGQYERYRQTTLRNIFYILRMRMKEPGLIIEFKENGTFDNYPVETVEIVDTENRSVLVSFHRTTHLPVRQVFQRRDPESKRLIEEAAVYNKYRETNGVMWPWSIVRYRDGDRIFELYSSSVVINNPKLDRNQFELGNAKRLSPE
jgi:hypothetical protein